MMFLPSIIMVSFYFSRRRALATGITVCGTGIGILVFSPVSQILMETYTWRGANIVLAAFLLNGIPCGLVYRPLSSSPETGGRFQRKKSSVPSDPAAVMTHNCKSLATCNEYSCRHNVDDDDDDNLTHALSSSFSRPDIFYSGTVINTSSLVTIYRNVQPACRHVVYSDLRVTT